MLDFGILGMNARNLSYIKKFNTKRAIRLADNKVKTKRFMGARGIPVPETYDVIKKPEQLRRYDFSQLPESEFIIKPSKGSRGRGIYRVKYQPGGANATDAVQSGSFFSRFHHKFSRVTPNHADTYRISGADVDDATFRRYLLDIIYGRNSLGASADQVMIEELLVPGEGFEQYCQYGLADIRVIVFNLIPVAAMLRVPTPESDGKANLDRGALGMGVEVGSGKIYAMYQHGKIYRGEFPDPYQGFANRILPYRDEILSFSSKAQYFANLGFLALDRVITEDGPKLLEINARAGLKFQLAAQIPLKNRLKKIEDIKVVTPEKGVEIAQTLFSEHKTQVVTPSKVLYLSQYGKIQYRDDGIKSVQDCIVDVDVMKRYNYLSQDLFDRLQDDTKTTISVSRAGIKLHDLQWRVSPKLKPNNVLLGRDAVADYFVKPLHRINTSIEFINPKNIQESEIDQLHILDKKIASLGYKLNTSKILTPTNYLAELDSFITWNGRYNPYFEYNWPSEKRMQTVYDDLMKLKEQYFGSSPLQSNFGKLFDDKIDELLKKHSLIAAYKSQKISKIMKANIDLYGELDEALSLEAKEKVLSIGNQDKQLLGKRLSRHEISITIKKYLKDRNIHNAKIVFDTEGQSRISVRRGKIITIRVSETSGLREIELLSLLAHEIDVHVRRYNAGLSTGWHIMKNGTAGYIRDEEGLAIHASELHLPEGYEKKGMYQKYHLLSVSGEKSFVDVISMVQSMADRTLLGAFKTVLRLKKGLRDTANRGGALHMKDKVYLEGYTEIERRREAGGMVDDLMIGKVKKEDLDLIL